MGLHGLMYMRKGGRGSPLLVSCFFYLILEVGMGPRGRKETDSRNSPLTVSRGKHYAIFRHLYIYLLFSV